MHYGQLFNGFLGLLWCSVRLLGCPTVMGKNTGLAGPTVGALKMFQGRPCLWSTFEVESSLTFGALKWAPLVSQPATTRWAHWIFRAVISIVGGWDVMVTDVTAPIYVWCIAGDFSTLPVGDAAATMTPDGNAVCSHFCAADTALFICSHHLRECRYCWGCSRESSAGPANEALSTLFVLSKARAIPVVWLAAA